MKSEYPLLSEKSMRILIPILTAYLHKATLWLWHSNLNSVQEDNKYIKITLHLALTSLEPQIHEIMSNKQESNVALNTFNNNNNNHNLSIILTPSSTWRTRCSESLITPISMNLNSRFFFFFNAVFLGLNSSKTSILNYRWQKITTSVKEARLEGFNTENSG